MQFQMYLVDSQQFLLHHGERVIKYIRENAYTYPVLSLQLLNMQLCLKAAQKGILLYVCTKSKFNIMYLNSNYLENIQYPFSHTLVIRVWHKTGFPVDTEAQNIFLSQHEALARSFLSGLSRGPLEPP